MHACVLHMCAGILNASVTVLIGTITGSVLGFWSCRVLLKEWFQRKINESPTLQAFMQTMESKGFYLILIMRMAPIPFGVQNGLFSVRLTRDEAPVPRHTGLMLSAVLLRCPTSRCCPFP